MSENELSGSGGRLRVPRTRGALSGIALIVLGLWGALVPFIGPYFDFAFTPRPDDAWHWTAARGWFEVLPGAVALVGGLLLLVSANRVMTLVGAWIAVAAGAWFVVGPELAPALTLGSVGSPANGGQDQRILEGLVYFTALGAAIVLFGALAAGRLSVHSLRDARFAARRDSDARRERTDTAPVVTDRTDTDRTDADRSDADRTDAHRADADEVTTNRAETGAAAPVAAAPPTSGGSTALSSAQDEQDAEPVRDAPAADAHVEESREGDSAEDGPAYAPPQRYVRAEPSEQIPVEQIRRDHPTD